MIIIGITGTIGAGKGTIVEYLVEKGFQHYSARDFIVEEIRRREMEIDRNSMTAIANELRKDHGPAFIIESLYNRALAKGENAVIESVRTVGEIEMLRDKEGFYLFAIDADIEKRYERIRLRGSSTDNVSFEEFRRDEEREMNNKDLFSQNLKACISKADYVFDNNSDIRSLHSEVERVLDEIVNIKANQ